MAANFEIEYRKIEVGKSGGYFTVRGMNSEDITFVTSNYLDDARAVVAKYADKTKIEKNAVAALVMEIAKMFPMLTVEIISRCADATDADSVAKFRLLPFVKQIEALKEIALLTIQDGGVEIKKVTEAVASLLEANGIQPGPLMILLQTITGISEKPSDT